MAFALSLDTQTEHALSIHTTTLFIVLLTVMVMGGATGPLLILLDVKPQAAGDEEEVDEVDSTFWMRLDRRCDDSRLLISCYDYHLIILP
jgi:NhaP-type Na+/H+ or K+/H+ antiporter